MKTAIECVPCFLQQALSAAQFASDDIELHEKVIRAVSLSVSTMDLNTSPPAMGQLIHRIIRELTGDVDPYRQVKSFSNQLALRLLPMLKKRTAASDDPFAAAARVAIAGNIIDFARNHDLNEHTILEAIESSFAAPLCRNNLSVFRDECSRAENILYLGDNAGEIVFDRLLMEMIGPEKITFAVRGHPTLNDATRADAEAGGISEMVRVIDNGTDVPGTILEQCSPAFREVFDEAGLIIAKGQGNYETLSNMKRNIFFLFKVKCPVVSRLTGLELGSLALMRHFSGDQMPGTI